MGVEGREEATGDAGPVDSGEVGPVQREIVDRDRDLDGRILRRRERRRRRSDGAWCGAGREDESGDGYEGGTHRRMSTMSPGSARTRSHVGAGEAA